MEKMTIAIDGPAASGKSTAAEKLAVKLGFLYFDTGVMYRAVTLAGLKRFGTIEDEEKIASLAKEVCIDVRPPTIQDGRKFDVLLDGEDVTWEIRSPWVTANVSPVSAYPEVRRELTEKQRRIGERGDVVMVGRDIGTIVMPDADIKFYVDASAEVRALRRFEEMAARGEAVEYQEVLDAIRKRDQIDSTRKVAPLVPAKDAILIMNNDISREEVVEMMLREIQIVKGR